MTKLTLSIDENVVEIAKEIAEANNTSVSAMFSQFVQSMADRRVRPGDVGPLTRKVSGIVTLPKGKNYKVLLSESLAAKHAVTK